MHLFSNGVRRPASILPLIRHPGTDTVNTCGAWLEALGRAGVAHCATLPPGDQLICSRVKSEGVEKRKEKSDTVAPLHADGSLVGSCAG